MKKITDKIKRDIKRSGWTVMKVLGDEETPDCCYSIGMHKNFEHPEIAILGLDLELAHAMVNYITESIKQGTRYTSGQFYSDILDDVNCLMLEALPENTEELFIYAQWFYQSTDFPVLQCLYPTVKGAYPWQDEWPEELSAVQPVLGDPETIPS